MGTVRFGLFSLDSATRQLLRDGREVSLSPKAFQLLSLLVANRARAVSRQELHEGLWPSTFVLDTNIASLIAEIRRALDDDAAKPRFIRTMHRFGYRFVGQGTSRRPRLFQRRAQRPTGWCGSRHVPLSEGSNLIGRGGCVGLIDATGVSRHHARILIDRGDATIEDLGSKNGTYVAGERVTNPRRLRDGDQIRVGSVVVTFQIPRVSVATETVS